jgi:hypothetical protein
MLDINVANFIESEKSKALKNGIVFVLEDANRVKYFNRMCNGFFEAEMNIEGEIKPCIATAIGKPQEEWLKTFIHETSHMDQFLENSVYWMSTSDCSICDKWLDGELFSQEIVNETINRIILLEADCEIRSLEKIVKYNLPVDLSDYSKTANAYLLFHHWMLRERKWYNKAPYEIKEVVDEMSDRLLPLNEYLVTPSEGVMKLFNLCK